MRSSAGVLFPQSVHVKEKMYENLEWVRAEEVHRLQASDWCDADMCPMLPSREDAESGPHKQRNVKSWWSAIFVVSKASSCLMISKAFHTTTVRPGRGGF